MACYHPEVAYRSREGRNPNGKWPLVFNRRQGYHDMPVKIPCGKCVGCRIDKSRDWATRCVLEASDWDENCFITLTYAQTGKDLVKRDFVLFMKKLRQEWSRGIAFIDHEGKKQIYKGVGLRFFHCGEYGSTGNRPHHHSCLFNFDFPDKKIWSIRDGVKLYHSEILDKIWGKGHTTVGEVTWKSAAYVARYVLKKINSTEREVPEYITMSRRPGVGKKWLDKYKDDVLKVDSIILREGRFRPPRYFDNKTLETHPIKMEQLKRNRIKKINENECTPERLAVRERLKLRQIKQLKRGIE